MAFQIDGELGLRNEGFARQMVQGAIVQAHRGFDPGRVQARYQFMQQGLVGHGGSFEWAGGKRALLRKLAPPSKGLIGAGLIHLANSPSLKALSVIWRSRLA